jgi:hypothetical protein
MVSTAGKTPFSAGFWTGGLGISDKINSAEDGRDGTNGYFQQNFGAVPWNRKLSEFRSEPFFFLRKRKQLIIEANSRNSIPYKLRCTVTRLDVNFRYPDQMS